MTNTEHAEWICTKCSWAGDYKDTYGVIPTAGSSGLYIKETEVLASVPPSLPECTSPLLRALDVLEGL